LAIKRGGIAQRDPANPGPFDEAHRYIAGEEFACHG
jgi:hypothetical protein